jgi:ribosomal protein L6P/L9E
MSLFPIDGDTTVVSIDSNTTTYTFKNTTLNQNDIQIAGTLSDTLDNLLFGITTSYSNYLSATSSITGGDTIIDYRVSIA